MKNTEKAKYYYTSKMHLVREFFFSLLEVLCYIYAVSCLSIQGQAKIKCCVNELRIKSKISIHPVSSLWKDMHLQEIVIPN